MSPRALTDFAIDRLLRRDVTWIKTAELYLWRDHHAGTQPVASAVFLSDATRYLPAATVVDRLLTAGPLTADGEGWITPAGWDGLSVVTPGGVSCLQVTNLNAGGGPNGGNVQLVGAGTGTPATDEMFGAVTMTEWVPIIDANARWAGVVLGAALDGSSYYGCIAEHTPAGAFHTTIYRYTASTRTTLIQVPTPADAWNTRRLYAETRHVATGLQITIRNGGPAGPIFAQVVDATPLTGLYAGPTIFNQAGNVNQVRLTTPMVGVSRREYLGAVLRWSQMGDSVEALRPASAASSVDLDVSDAVPISALEMFGPTVGAVHRYPRFSAMVNDAAQTGVGYDIGDSGLFIRWVPEGGILGASNYQLNSSDQAADDVLAHAGLFDTWKVSDRDVVTLQSTSAEGVTSVRVDQAAVANAPVGLVSPLDWRNGFEEGSLVTHNTANLSSVWTYVTVGTFDTGPTGVVIIPGFHNASQFAVRFTSVASNNPSGGELNKEGGGGTGVMYGKGMYRAQVVPSGGSGGGPMRIVTLNTTGTPPMRIYWLPSGKYRLQNVGQSTTADSMYTMGALDRLEWRCTLGASGGVELRIYGGDSRVPREPPLVLAGDPTGSGSILGTSWLADGGTGHTGSYDLDDVGMSTQGWMGPGTNIIAVPSAPVLTQWTPSAGTNVDCIDDHPGVLNDANYITAATVWLTDQYRWTIPAAAAVPAGALFYRAQIYIRGSSAGSYQVLPIIWDELGNVAGGLPWAVATLNPNGSQATVFAPGGRSLAQLQRWNLGVQRLSATGGALTVTVLYGLLEYIT